MNLTDTTQNGHWPEHRTNGHASLKVKTKILLFATYALVLESLGAYLESTGDIEIVEGTTAADRLPDLAAKSHYDLVILCLLGDESTGLEIIPQLSKIDPNVRVLILSGSNEISVHQRAVEHGASGIVLRQQDGKTLLRAIRQVHEGGTWFNQKLLSQILNKNGNNGNVHDPETLKLQYLTAREREIIKALALGMNNKLLGKTLHISEATVRHHLSSIYGKLDIADRLNLLIFAYQHKLADVGADRESPNP
jgi:two-component system, NarL family, nitrate/nitrite response regulator NarL